MNQLTRDHATGEEYDMNTTGISGRHRIALVVALLATCVAGFGCSATPIGFAMSVAGEAVNDVDASERAKAFVGQPVSQADAALGAPAEILSDTRGTRTWRLYKVPMDAMDTARYVVEVEASRILAVSKVQQYTDLVEYEGTLALLRPKVMGKSPAECEANLKMGPPLLTVRSKATGQIVQLFDARLSKDLPGLRYCVLRFGQSNTCEKLNVVKAYTTGGKGLTGK